MTQINLAIKFKFNWMELMLLYRGIITALLKNDRSFFSDSSQ